MYRPKPHILISINSDGSGSIKQYDSYQDAKAAYNALSSGTISAFIYAKPNKSLGSGAIGSPLAIPAKVEFTKVQNATAVYNSGNPSYSAPHPSIVQYNSPGAPIQTPPLPRIVDPGVFGGSEEYRAWQIFCSAHPTHPECTLPGNPVFGTLLGAGCQISQGSFSDENERDWLNVAPIKEVRYADGRGGEFTENPYAINSKEGGCFWPQGYATEGINSMTYYDNMVTIPECLINVAIMTYTTGGGWMPIRDTFLADCWSYYGGQDGQGNQKELVVVGVNKIGLGPHKGLIDYNTRSYLRDVNGNLHDKSVNGFVVTNEPTEKEVHTGRWYVDFNYYLSQLPENTEVGQNIGSYPRRVRIRFKYKPTTNPISPFETVPSASKAGRAVINSFSGELDGIDSTETIQPLVEYEYEYQNVFISEVGYDAPCAQKQKATITDVVDGPYVSGWSDMEYYVAGTTLASDSVNYYKADGVGGYYAEPIPDPPPECPLEGTYLDYGDRPIYLTVDADNCPSVELGSQHFDIYADGVCGTYEEPGQSTYSPNGTYLTHGTNYNYFSTGDGGYYTEPRVVNPPSGTELGTFTDQPIYDSESGFQVGYQHSPDIADGNGGSTPGAGSFFYSGNGTFLGIANGLDYYSNGTGGSYSQPHTYEPYGTYITSVYEPYFINIGYGDWFSGNQYNDVFADGSGGSYSINGSNTMGQTGWFPDGAFLGTDFQGAPFFANGSGLWYSPAYLSIGTVLGYPNYVAENHDAGCGIMWLGYNQYTQYADGKGGSFETLVDHYWSNGFIGQCNGYNYYANGNGGYGAYPVEGTYLGSGSGTNTTNVGCGDWVVGGYSYDTFADGSGGTYDNGTGGGYTSYGSYLGDCNGYHYYTDGSGGTYTEQIDNGGGGGCPSAGEWVGRDGDYDYYTDGNCGSYSVYNPSCASSGTFLDGGTAPVNVNAGCGEISVGEYSWAQYANGECGSYIDQGSPFYYYSYGQQIGECEMTAIYFDGQGGYYT